MLNKTTVFKDLLYITLGCGNKKIKVTNNNPVMERKEGLQDHRIQRGYGPLYGLCGPVYSSFDVSIPLGDLKSQSLFSCFIECLEALTSPFGWSPKLFNLTPCSPRTKMDLLSIPFQQDTTSCFPMHYMGMHLEVLIHNRIRKPKSVLGVMPFLV